MASGEKLKDRLPQLGICKTLHGLNIQDLNMVPSKFGQVPFGSVLSYQCPPETSRDIINHPACLDFPQLPVDGYRYTHAPPPGFQPTDQQQCHLESLQVSRVLSAEIEKETRQQSGCKLWKEVRAPRITASRFREVCFVRGGATSKTLLARMLKGGIQTAAMKKGLEQEEEILRRYADCFDVSVTQCGFIIHPDAPHLGASPDGKVYDPLGTPPFGLAEVKSCFVEDLTHVTYLHTINGKFTLKKSHKYFYQVQGQLAVSGLQWCDFITDTINDYAVERIYRDEEIILSMREKLDNFFFYIYMDMFLNRKA